MIEADKRKAIFLLHEQGMTLRDIAKRLAVSRNTVRGIIRQEGQMPQSIRQDKLSIDPELLRKLYEQCAGRIQRVHEKLIEEERIEVKYSTLTRMLRKEGISKSPTTRCDRVPDEPGVEMQHDTTLYRVKFDSKPVNVIASCIYLRYSKRRYLRFYRTFNRFKMKCFFHEALMFWGYSAKNCIIDNTNLARLRGTGKNAVIVPEMETFSKQYGFQYCCHEKNHPNRKAGEERSFWTVETNFLPGRIFDSLEDMNRQALEWSTVRMENRAQTKAGLIPAKVFEFERSFLNQLPAYLPAPYRIHTRGIDQYGFLAFDGNFYWVPGTDRGDVKALEYSDFLRVYRARILLIEYPLPPDGVKNEPFSPKGQPPPRYKPKNRKHPTDEEEKCLRAMAESVNAYLDFALATKGIQRHEFLRRLIALSRKMTPQLFVKCIERAHTYRITGIEIIQRISLLHLGELSHNLPFAELTEAFQQREAYQDGLNTEQPDLSVYQEKEEPEDE